MSTISEAVGMNLRYARQDNQLSQREVAREAGISVSFLSDVENGRRSISAINLASLCDVLGLSMDEVMGRGRHHA